MSTSYQDKEFATHVLMVMHPCAKYGKPMSNQKKVIGRTRLITDRWTDRQTQTGRVIPIYPPELRSRGGGGNKKYFRKYLNKTDNFFVFAEEHLRNPYFMKRRLNIKTSNSIKDTDKIFSLSDE